MELIEFKNAIEIYQCLNCGWRVEKSPLTNYIKYGYINLEKQKFDKNWDISDCDWLMIFDNE